VLDTIRLPFFIAAAFSLLLALLAELLASDLFVTLSGGLVHHGGTPGIAINDLAVIDAILLYSITVMVLGAVFPRSVVGRVQAPVTLVVSLLGLIGTVVLVGIAFALLVLMVTLLVAVPFGTIAYLAAWGHFARGEAAATLAMVMTLKLMFCGFLLLAQQRFLAMKGLLLLIGLSLGFTWLVGFLHAFVPIFLVSIADAIAALIITIIGAIWLLIIFVLAIVAVVKALLSIRRVEEWN
jgi:hypothetical protein